MLLKALFLTLLLGYIVNRLALAVLSKRARRRGDLARAEQLSRRSRFVSMVLGALTACGFVALVVLVTR